MEMGVDGMNNDLIITITFAFIGFNFFMLLWTISELYILRKKIKTFKHFLKPLSRK